MVVDDGQLVIWLVWAVLGRILTTLLDVAAAAVLMASTFALAVVRVSRFVGPAGLSFRLGVGESLSVRWGPMV